MKLTWTYLLALIIALTSISFDRPMTVKFSDNQISSIDHVPLWESDSLRNPHEHFSERAHFIAQDFIAIVEISDHSDPTPIDFYLPLHGLIQEEDFYLII